MSMSLYAQNGDVIGRVLLTQGRVEARDAAGNVRALTRKSEIFAQDTILVGADGFAQVRMVDKAMISLKSNTEFRFDNYEFDDNPATPDSAVMSMVRGGFRTISGSIGTSDDDQHGVVTPYASIGIRGTFHGATITGSDTPDPGDDGVDTGTWDGGTTVTSPISGQSMDLGLEGEFDFSHTDSQGEIFGLVDTPDSMRDNFFLGVTFEDNGGDEDAADASGDGQTGDGAATGDNGNAANGGNAGNGGDGNANANPPRQ